MEQGLQAARKAECDLAVLKVELVNKDTGLTVARTKIEQLSADKEELESRLAEQIREYYFTHPSWGYSVTGVSGRARGFHATVCATGTPRGKGDRGCSYQPC